MTRKNVGCLKTRPLVLEGGTVGKPAGFEIGRVSIGKVFSERYSERYVDDKPSRKEIREKLRAEAQHLLNKIVIGWIQKNP